MASKMLKTQDFPDLQPARQLWALGDPAQAPFRFQARDRKAALAWQKRTRAALMDLLGVSDQPVWKEFRAQSVESVDKGDYVREKVLIHVQPKALMPVYLLLPKRAPRPGPAVLALAGHGYGVKDIVGLWEDGAEREVPDGYHKDFAVALCRRGFAVAAPEISCFGERQTDFSYLEPGQGAPSTCTHTAMLAFHLGRSVVGLRVLEARRLVDYLATRREFDCSRLGAMGISGGGMHTFFSACTDTRIKAAVISGYYSTFKDSILGMSHCACNFVPGLHQFGEMYDLVGLLAPRPILVEAGDHDPIFPIAAVRRSVERAGQVYGTFDAAGGIETDFFEGRHQISGAKAYDFLWEGLAGG